MTYGLRVVNPDTGNVTIDNNYMNSAIMMWGFVRDLPIHTYAYYNVKPNWSGDGVRAYALPNLSNLTAPIVVVEMKEGKWFSTGTSGRVGNNPPVNYIFSWQDPADARYFIFASNVSAHAGTGNFGLKVMNDAGQVCFDSRLNYLKVIGLVNNITISNNPTIVSDTFDIAKTVGILMPIGSQGWAITTVGGMAYGGQYINLFTRSGNKIGVQRFEAQADPNATGFEAQVWFNTTQAMIIDLTNF